MKRLFSLTPRFIGVWSGHGKLKTVFNGFSGLHACALAKREASETQAKHPLTVFWLACTIASVHAPAAHNLTRPRIGFGAAIMIKTTIDKAKNRLGIIYSGRVTPEQTEDGMQKLQTTLARIQPGFRLLADLSALESMDLACVPHLEWMMDMCNRMGVEVVARVIPNPKKDIGMNIMSVFHYQRRVRIVTCKTIAEAKRALES
jgi:hypothetical protein